MISLIVMIIMLVMIIGGRYDHRDHQDNHDYLDQCDHQTKTATTTNPSPRRVKLSNELKKSSYQLMLIVEYY